MLEDGRSAESVIQKKNAFKLSSRDTKKFVRSKISFIYLGIYSLCMAGKVFESIEAFLNCVTECHEKIDAGLLFTNAAELESNAASHESSV